MSAGRLARVVALAMIIGLGIINLYWAFTMWNLSDAGAYWHAALRLREGAPLYPAVANIDASDVYRYAPWFAWLTVPFTYLPQQVAGALWSVVLLAASALAVVPMVRARAWLQVAFFLPILVGISAVGNVQPLLVAALMWSVGRRSGPLWIGVVASLKIFPLLFVAVYLGRREWSRAAVSIAVAAALWAPALLYDLRGYTTDAGQAASLFALPAVWAVVIGAGVVLSVRLAKTRLAWLAAATTVVVSFPRLFVYDVTYLMVGAVPNGRLRLTR
ncbi:MAG: DUF2029 domain-containing protein [Chloroflexi bacterium]|nr:DUF2029 domain-containing protein [Chloroflexota bacterium]